jgi:TonB family protein
LELKKSSFGFILASMALLVPMSARAQTSAPQNPGTEMAEALTKAKIRKVAVFDFVGPGDKLNALGRELADKFSATLQSSGPGILVVDRSAIQKIIDDNRLSPDVIRNTEIAWWLAEKLDVDAMVLGEIAVSADQLEIDIESIGVRKGNSIHRFSTSASLSDTMKALLSTPVQGALAPNTTEVLAAHGTIPVCIHCPSPTFSQVAVDKHIEGTVVLFVVIGIDGRADSIEIKKPMSYRLTEKAIEAVQGWTFAPGKTADGKPIAVLTPIELTFKLSK